MTGPTFATVTLDPSGGGIAAVSRLIWRVLGDRWHDEARLVTLMNGPGPRLDAGARVAFGARLAAAQMRGDAGWVFYGHVAAARVQQFVPARLGKPYGIFLHGIEAWRPLTPARRSALENAALLVANSEYTARRIVAAHPWMPPILACPLALLPDESAADSRDDVGRAGPNASAPDIGPEAVIVVARMDPAERYKGHDQLLEAWPAVHERRPAARLVFVGGGEDAGRLQAKAASLGIGSQVIFTGFVAEATLSDLYDRAALFAMPSREEGFGLVYLEAMRHGLCCLGSIHDAAGEVIADGTTGVLVDQARVDVLADRLTDLLSDPDRRRAMGDAGRLRAARQFGYDRFRDRFLAILADRFDRREAVTA